MSIKSKIESLLFISAKPMTVGQLAGLIKKSPKEVDAAGEELMQAYKENGGGLQIIKNGSKYQMVSSAENALISLSSAFPWYERMRRHSRAASSAKAYSTTAFLWTAAASSVSVRALTMLPPTVVATMRASKK